MLSRDIYRDLYDEPGPTIEEKLFLAGKRIGIALAGCALILGALDFAGIHSMSGAGDFLQLTRTRVASLGSGASNTSSAPSSSRVTHDSIRVAIPKTVSKPPVRQPAAVDELAAARSKDAIAMAMTTSALSGLASKPPPATTPAISALKTVPQAPAIPSVMRPIELPEAAARSQASVPPADKIQLASLSAQESKQESKQEPKSDPLPVAPSASLALTAPITIPLSEVPLPRAAPPLSPAERLGLKDKEYARAERCLANAIYFEARSEPIRGQMAVAQVVVNRAFSGFYPNDICGVVYQNANRHLSCQFTFACDGKRKIITERGHWAVANRIARQTLNGQIYVPEVAKSTHYHAAYVHPNWVREMKRLVRFGVHSFYRPYAWGNGQEDPVWGSAADAVRVHKTAAR